MYSLVSSSINKEKNNNWKAVVCKITKAKCFQWRRSKLCPDLPYSPSERAWTRVAWILCGFRSLCPFKDSVCNCAAIDLKHSSATQWMNFRCCQPPRRQMLSVSSFSCLQLLSPRRLFSFLFPVLVLGPDNFFLLQQGWHRCTALISLQHKRWSKYQ